MLAFHLYITGTTPFRNADKTAFLKKLPGFGGENELFSAAATYEHLGFCGFKHMDSNLSRASVPFHPLLTHGLPMRTDHHRQRENFNTNRAWETTLLMKTGGESTQTPPVSFFGHARTHSRRASPVHTRLEHCETKRGFGSSLSASHLYCVSYYQIGCHQPANHNSEHNQHAPNIIDKYDDDDKSGRKVICT
jgi:hypothetical protein